MGAEELEHRPVRGGIADGFTQAAWSQAGQVEKTLRALCVRKDPAERTKGNPCRVLNRIFRPVNNCQPSVKEILVA